VYPRAVTVPAVSDSDRQFPSITELQERFVVEYATNGGKGERAAVSAGYSKASARTLASRLLTNPVICDAIMQVVRMQQAVMVPEAQQTVLRLMRKSKSDYVRLEAAKDVQTRAGLNAPQRVAVAGAVSISIDLGD
jgi:phage terminase small subunit